VRGNMWNAGVAANHCRIAMNRLRIHHINHEKIVELWQSVYISKLASKAELVRVS